MIQRMHFSVVLGHAQIRVADQIDCVTHDYSVGDRPNHHPNNSKDELVSLLTTDIAKTDRSHCLNRPVERDNVLLLRW